MIRLFFISMAFIIALGAFGIHTVYFDTEIRTIQVEGKFRRQIANDKGSLDISFITTDTGLYRLPIHGEFGGYDDPRQLWKSLHVGCTIIVEAAKHAPSYTDRLATRVDTIVDASHCTEAENINHTLHRHASDHPDPTIMISHFAQMKDDNITLVQFGQTATSN